MEKVKLTTVLMLAGKEWIAIENQGRHRQIHQYRPGLHSPNPLI
jgi:hypothetical protein